MGLLATGTLRGRFARAASPLGSDTVLGMGEQLRKYTFMPHKILEKLRSHLQACRTVGLSFGVNAVHED